jgi:hypothetical protein
MLFGVEHLGDDTGIRINENIEHSKCHKCLKKLSRIIDWIIPLRSDVHAISVTDILT